MAQHSIRWYIDAIERDRYYGVFSEFNVWFVSLLAIVKAHPGRRPLDTGKPTMLPTTLQIININGHFTDYTIGIVARIVSEVFTTG